MARVKRTKLGTPLTPELAEELANEAAAGYDLDAAARKRIGRPSLDRGISPRLDLRVEPDLAQALRDRAEEEHRSVSAVAREALRRYLAS